VVLRVRSTLRRRWRSAAIVAFIVAIAAGAVLTLAAGALRTASAPAAFTTSVGGDAAAQVQQQGGPPRTADVARLPGVQSVQAVTFAFVEMGAAGDAASTNSLSFIGATPLASRLVAGRPTDPTKPFEFVADKKFVAAHHAHVGSTFPAISWNQTQADAGQGFGPVAKGPSFTAVLVGIVDSASDLEDSYNTAVFSPALFREHVGIVATIVSVRTRPGITVAELRAQLDSLKDGSSLSVGPGTVVSAEIRTAVDAQANGTWLMAAVTAVAAVVVLGQLLTRQARLTDDERDSLAAVGFTRAQAIAVGAAQAAAPAIAGIAAGLVIAIGFSWIFPAGFVRELEPHPGVRVDAFALGLGAVALLGLFGAWVLVALITFGPERHRRPRPTTTDAIARRAPSATAAVGARFALTTRGRSSVGTIVSLAVVVAGIVGATAFAVSLDRLVTHRARFGGNYSLAFGDNSDLTAAQLEKSLANDPDIVAMMILTGDQARSGKATVDLVGFEEVRGGLTPDVLSGRLPSGPDELALGRVSARELHLHVGDTLDLERDTDAGKTLRGSYRVVGLVVVPGIAGNDGVGKGALLASAGFRRIVPAPASTMAAVDLRPGAPPNTRSRLSIHAGTTGGLEDPPGAIVNVGRVRRIPAFLAVLLAALLAMSMLNAVIVSIQFRRHDLAVLAALGADRRWIARAVHWQTTVLAVLPLVAGIPLGLLAGSAAFRDFTNRIGAVPDPALPLALVGGLAVAILVVANVVAVVPTRRARHLSPAEQLRVD
jgi:hypothetical protein